MHPARRHHLWALQHRLAPYLFVLPFLVLFSVFLLYPLARTLYLSICDEQEAPSGKIAA